MKLLPLVRSTKFLCSSRLRSCAGAGKRRGLVSSSGLGFCFSGDFSFILGLTKWPVKD